MIVYLAFLNVPYPPDVNQCTWPKNVGGAKSHYKQSGSNNSQSLLEFHLRRVSAWFVNQFQIRDPLLLSRCGRSYLSMIDESSAPGTYCGSASFGCFYHVVELIQKRSPPIAAQKLHGTQIPCHSNWKEMVWLWNEPALVELWAGADDSLFENYSM